MGTASDQTKKTIFIKDLDKDTQIRTSFLVQQKSLMVAKNGKPYLSLILSDSTGAIDTRVWNDAESIGSRFQEGDIVAISGRTHFFQNRLQLVVDDLVPMPPEEVDPGEYLPKAAENLDELYQNLIGVIEDLENPWIRKLGLALLGDPEIAGRFKISPAAKTIHHACIGGLLIHSLQLTRLLNAILPLYPGIDRSLAIFGATFHDLGKIHELSYQGKLGYSDEGRMLGHIAIGISLIDRKLQELPAFPKELEWQLKHMVLSHHGTLENGSPKRPQTLEAQLIHHLDDLDSKIDSIQTLIKSERNHSRWTSLHKAYDVYYFKPEGPSTETSV